MMKHLYILFIATILFILPNFVSAQGGITDSIRTKYDTISFWSGLADIAFTLQQVGLKNWTAGGDDLLSMNFSGRALALKEKDRFLWRNIFEANYSLTKQGEQKRFRANTDTWKIISRYSYSLENNWSLTASLIFQSQFGKLYKISKDEDTGDEILTLSSDILSPGYVWPSMGFTYSKNEKWAISLMPVSGKLIIVLDDSLSNVGAFGVSPGEKFRSESGFGIDGYIKSEIIKNINIESDLSIFTRYIDFFKTDVRWNIKLRFKVNKFFSAFYSNNLIYDIDVSDAVQFRYNINLGLAYDITF